MASASLDAALMGRACGLESRSCTLSRGLRCLCAVEAALCHRGALGSHAQRLGLALDPCRVEDPWVPAWRNSSIACKSRRWCLWRAMRPSLGSPRSGTWCLKACLAPAGWRLAAAIGHRVGHLKDSQLSAQDLIDLIGAAGRLGGRLHMMTRALADQLEPSLLAKCLSRAV